MLRNNSDSKINSIIGPEVEVDGDVRVVGSILIYGKINGGVKATGSVRTAQGSYIKGNIESKDANISGKIDGDLKVDNKTILEKKCDLKGNLTTGIVIIEEGANFDGICNMINKSEAEKDIKSSDTDFEASLANKED